MKINKEKNASALVYLFGTTIILVCVSLITLFSLAIAGIIRLDKKGLAITTGSDLIEYDGDYHEVDQYDITFGKIQDNEALQRISTTKEKDLGVYENAMDFKVVDRENGDDHTGDYQISYQFGKMEIAHWILLLKSGDAAKIYDGKPLVEHSYTIKKGTLYNGDTLSVDFPSSQTMVGFCDNLMNVKITGTDGSDRTKEYSLRMEYGKLVVTVSPDGSISPSSIPDGSGSGQSSASSDVGGGPISSGGSNSGSMGGSGSMSGSQGESGSVGPGSDASVPSSSPKLASTPYLRLTTSYRGGLYLRQKSFGNWNGRGWEQATPFDFSPYPLNPRRLASDKVANSGLSASAFKIDKKIDDGYFFEPYYAKGLSLVAADDVGATVHGPLSYSVDSVPYSYETSPATVDSISFSTSAIQNEEADYRQFALNNYLSVPENDKAFLSGICKDNGLQQGDPELIAKVASFVRGAAKYNLEFAPFPEDQDFVVYFLSVAKEGICSHFASAATLLYRMLGIPARFTSGFYVSCEKDSTLVTTDSAHAWVEVYREGTGWVQLEVTGSSYTNSSTSNPTAGTANLLVTSQDQEWEYDGLPHSNSDFTYQGDLPKGFSINITDCPSITDVGTISNTFQVHILNGNGEDVSSSFKIKRSYGTLTVNPRKIDVKLGSASKVYDGTELTCGDYELTSNNLVEGHVLTVVTKGSQKEVGVSYNTVGSWSVKDASGNDVTGNYALIPVFGLLTVTRNS